MGFLNWKDWVGGALNVFKETPASDIGEGLIRHEWQGDKYNVQQTGTTLKADIMNNLQMGLDFLVDSNHTVVNSEDHYIVTIDGLKTITSNPDGYELTENLHFSFKVTEGNTNGISKLIINGDSYDLKKIVSGSVAELSVNDIQGNRIYKVYYDGTQFIIDNSILLATETEAGIISINEIIQAIRMSETLNILGLEYGGDFGTDLTSIEANKVYFYKDTTTGRSIPYVALADKTGTFITPDTDNFKSLTNRDNLFHKKLSITTSAVNGINLSIAYMYANLIFVNGYITDATTLNNIPVGQTIVNLSGMIPELSSYGIYPTTVTGSNLDIQSNFALTKATGLTFQNGEHFTITAGVYKGTIL